MTLAKYFTDINPNTLSENNYHILRHFRNVSFIKSVKMHVSTFILENMTINTDDIELLEWLVDKLEERKEDIKKNLYQNF